MKKSSRMTKAAALGMSAAMLATAMPTGMAQAALVSTGSVVQKTEAAAARQKVTAVRQALKAWGIAPEEAAARVQTMSDAEVQRLAARVDNLPAGGDAVGAIIGAAVLIFIILLITDIVGVTDVFPFVHKAQ
jgi:hypothetical protein